MRSSQLAFLTLSAALSVYQPSDSQARELQKNTTGVPTYPKDDGGIMDSQFRIGPHGMECMHYSSDTNDALADVEIWYKKTLPRAVIADINKESLYAPIVLNGIKLLSGNDIVNVYRIPGRDHTVIEIFKCKEARSK
ncbi:MAG: hypothetical protein ABI460_20710 [Caldimonas sp.]